MKRLVFCVLLASCGGDNGSIAVDDLGMELAIPSCRVQFDCCTDAELMAQFMGITYDGHAIETEEQCVEFSNAFFSGLATVRYKDSIAKGRVEYDGEAAADCVAAISDLSCGEFASGTLEELAGCRPFLTAKVANGGACSQDYECTSANCVGETNPLGQPSTDGACMPMPAEGEACDDNCPGDLICDRGQGTTETCQAPRADGEQCNVDSQCASDYCDSVCGMEPVTCDGR